MLEETITELCALAKIPEVTLRLYNRTDAYFTKEIKKKGETETRKSICLHHYKTKELEGITIRCIQDDDLEIDIITYPEDSTYIMEIQIKTYCLAEIQALAEEIENSSSTYQKAKKQITEKAFPCQDPYDTQAIIQIDKDEQKHAAGFAYTLISDYIQHLAKKEKEAKEAKKQGRKQSTIAPEA